MCMLLIHSERWGGEEERKNEGEEERERRRERGRKKKNSYKLYHSLYQSDFPLFIYVIHFHS